MSKFTRPLEPATRKDIDLILNNLGWKTDESKPDCNVFTERAKTTEQNEKFQGNNPDYVLYKSGTDEPIAIIEAKRKGQGIEQAIQDAETKYAIPLGVKVVFAYDGAFFQSWHIDAHKELLTDGVTITQLITEKKLLRFIQEGYSVSEISPTVKHSRAELITIFKWANTLLRKEGLRQGIERFSEFANLIFLKLISELESEREKNGEPRILDTQYSWEAFANMDKIPMMNYINDTVLPKLVHDYNHSSEVFQRKLLIKNPATLKEIVDKLTSINLTDADSDVKGDAFEYFIKDSVTVGNDLGEYFTPRHIVDLMIELIEPKFGETVYDPTCGTGGFLISAFRYIKKRCANTPENIAKLKNETVYGIELTNTAKIAKMNMILTGDGHANILQTDSLANPVDEKYWIALANPPYGQPTDYGNFYPIPSDDGDAIFVQHIYKSLKVGGRAAVVVPEGFLFRSNLKEVRKFLLQKCDVIAVISLPKGIFRPYTSNKTDIVIFRKDSKGTKSVWLYNLEADGFDLNSDFRMPVDENDIPDLLAKWSDKTESNKSWNVDIATIKAHDFELMVKTYQQHLEYTSQFPQVKFSEVMKENKEYITINDETDYKRITVMYHGQGVFPRDTRKGKNIKTKAQKVVRAGQFIVAEMDAKYGAFGVIPSPLVGAIVSSHYFLFDLDESKIFPRYFDYAIRFGPYEKLIQPSVKGTTNYAAPRPKNILDMTLPLPSKDEQIKIVKELDQQLALKEEAERNFKSLVQHNLVEPSFKPQDR
jgi:type I restriction enzyme M protein